MEVKALESYSVLLVDDEKEFLDLLLERLKMRRVNVEGVYNGTEALALLGKKPKDVVVLDVRIPGMNGIETLKEIKKQHPLIEVIMLTGHADMEIAIQGMELGAFEYLLKPIEIDELLYKIEDAYKKKLLHEQKIESKKRTLEKHISDSESD